MLTLTHPLLSRLTKKALQLLHFKQRLINISSNSVGSSDMMEMKMLMFPLFSKRVLPPLQTKGKILKKKKGDGYIYFTLNKLDK